MNKSSKRQFYFSLFRLLARLRGEDARRAESNGFEAALVGLMMFAIHYLFFATLFIPSRFEPWLAALLLVALAFGVWISWLLLLYLNSVIIKFLRLCGFFREIPTRRTQSIFWGIATTAMACSLLNKGSRWVHEVGAIWLVAVALNLVAALILAFTDATHPPGE